LDGALADVDAQFQQFTTGALGAQQPVLRDHTSDEHDGFQGQLGSALARKQLTHFHIQPTSYCDGRKVHPTVIE
jgi:hypothetical protein